MSSSTSVTSICNMALSHLTSKARLTSIDDASAEAYVCKLFYEEARDSTLADFDWAFARREVTLAELSDFDVPAGWDYAFAYPGDCVRALRIPQETDPLVSYDFEIRTKYEDGASEGRVILTTVEVPTLVYTRRVENPTVYSPGFIQALSWRLAFDISPGVTGTVRRDLMQTYLTVLSHAQATSLNEGGPGERQHDQTATWVTGRN